MLCIHYEYTAYYVQLHIHVQRVQHISRDNNILFSFFFLPFPLPFLPFFVPVLATLGFLHAIDRLMVIEHEMRPVRHKHATLPVDALLLEIIELIKEGWQVDHDAIAENDLGLGVEQAARDKMEMVLFGADDNRVASIVAALKKKR